jgi:hypothetical protein
MVPNIAMPGAPIMVANRDNNVQIIVNLIILTICGSYPEIPDN